MMNRSLLMIFLILTLTLLTSAVTAETAVSGECGENLTWTLESGVLTISGTGDMTDYTSFGADTPWYSSRDSIQSVVVESGVTSIGDYAFHNCMSVAEMQLPDGLNDIGKSAFCCTMLNQAALPDGLTIIGESAFNSCQLLTEVSFSSQISSIGSYGFYNCPGLKKLTFPGETMPTLGECAFLDCNPTVVCKAGSQVEVWAKSEGFTVESIEEDAPTSGACGESLVWNLTDNILTISGDGNMYDYAQEEAPWYAHSGAIARVQFEGDVTSVGDYAFFGFSKIGYISLPSSVTRIGEGAFGYCENLYDFYCPESLVEIGDYAFESCYGLCEFIGNDLLTTLGKGVFYDCGSMYYLGLPDTVTTLGEGVFENTDFSSFTVPAGVIVIPENAFKGNGSLSKVRLHSNVSGIAMRAFADCEALTEITFPAAMVTVGDYAFTTGTQITINFLGSTPPYFSVDVFSVPPIIGCFEGSDVEKWAIEMGYEVKHLSPYLSAGACGESTTFALSYDGVLTLSGTGSVTEMPWKDSEDFEFDTLIVDPGVTQLCDHAFEDANLTSVTLPEGLVSIGEYAFAGNEITALVLPSTLTEIGGNAFTFCEQLESVNIPAGVCVISDSAFNECYALTSVSLAEGLTEIQRYAFCSTALESIDLPSTLTTISNSAFYGCNFTELTIPDSVTKIENYAFMSCSNLETVTFLGMDMPTIYGSSFTTSFKVRCLKGSAAEEWALENGREVIYLESEVDPIVFTLPAGLTKIDAEAFMNATVTEVILPACTESIGSRAFANCAGLTRVVIPGETISIADDAFEGCDGITFVCPDDSDAATWAAGHGFSHTAE